MKKILTALALAVAAFAASAAPIQTSGTLTLNAFEHSPTPSGTVFGYGSPVSAGLGAFQATFDDGFSPEDFLAYCVDLFSPAGLFGATLSYDSIRYNQADFGAALEPANITALSKLFTFNGGTDNLDATKSAGMQLAVWELLYDGEGGDLTTGDFTAGSAPVAAKAWATSLLAGAATSATDYSITLFSDTAYTTKPGYQNFITAKFNSGGSCEQGNLDPNCNTVSEPTGLALAGLGLAALAVTRRRKSNSSS